MCLDFQASPRWESACADNARMCRAVRFHFVLVLGLGLLALAGYAALDRTTSDWFERDLELGANLQELAQRGTPR